MQRIDFVYSAPIPVGHRVQVTWFRVSKSGLLGKRSDDRPFEPAIKDLETGIEYVSDFTLPHSGAKLPDVPLDVRNEPPEGAEVETVLEGRVAFCRVVTIRGFADYDVQTTLVIDPEP